MCLLSNFNDFPYVETLMQGKQHRTEQSRYYHNKHKRDSDTYCMEVQAGVSVGYRCTLYKIFQLDE